jgi:mannosyltransferase
MQIQERRQTSRRPLTSKAGRWGALARHRAFLPALIGIFAMAVSLINVGTPSIWLDEAATVTGSSRSISQLLQMSQSVDAVHAAYYAVMHVVFEIFGYSPVTLRAPSAVAVGGAAALTVVFGRQLDRSKLGIIAGFIYAVLPRTTWSGIEGRSFAFTSLLAIALTVLFVHAARSSRTTWWVVYSVLTVVATLIFVYLALVIVAHAVALTILLIARRTRLRNDSFEPRFWLKWVVATAVAVVLLVPFLITVTGQTGQVQWLGPLGAHTRSEVLRSQWFLHSPVFAAIGWLFLALGLFRVLRFRERHFTASLLIPLLLVPTAALLAVSAVYTPVYNPRYLVMCLPFVAMFMAVGVDGLRGKYTAAVAVAVIAAVAVPQFAAQRQPQAREKERSSWSQVAETIASDRLNNSAAGALQTAVVYGDSGFHGLSGRVIAFSYPEAFAGIVDIMERTPASEAPGLWSVDQRLEDSLGRLDGLDDAYVISAGADEDFPAMVEAIESAGFSSDASWDVNDVRVVRLVRE